MLKRLWNYRKDEDSLVRDSFLLFSATTIVNAGAFLFHVIMGRFLGPANYGILGTLLTILYIINVPVNVIQTIITKFVSEFNANSDLDNINSLIRRSLKKLFIFGIVAAVFIIIVSPIAADFLHTTNLSILLLSPIILFSFLLPVIRGNLQGLQKFKHLGLNLIFEIIFKLGVGILFVYLGFKVYGAILAVVFSFLFPILFGLAQIKNYLTKKENGSGLETKQIYKYAQPVLISLTLLSFLFTIDVFLVKHFFNEILAGYYVAAALVGKIIFFATFAISQVMFPKSVENFSLNKPTKKILKKSLFLVSLIAIPATIIYFLFPRVITIILFGKDYLPITGLLGLFGIAISLFSLSYILVLYNLSINKTSLIYFLILAAVLETILIFFVHDTLLQILLILASTMAVVFLFLLSYTFIGAKWSGSQ